MFSNLVYDVCFQGATVSTSGTTNLAARTTQPSAPGEVNAQSLYEIYARNQTTKIASLCTRGSRLLVLLCYFIAHVLHVYTYN